MRTITYREALKEALREEMIRDETVFLMGEDIGTYGGCYKMTEGLSEKFCSERGREKPNSGAGFIRAAFGGGITGVRPGAENK